MGRAERRAAQRAEREGREAQSRRPRGRKQPVGDRLAKLIEEDSGLQTERYPNEGSSWDNPRPIAEVRAKTGGRVRFKQRYVVGEGSWDVKLHETPSDRLLEFGIALADELQEGERVEFSPRDAEVHEIVTGDPDRLVAYLTEAGATVTAINDGWPNIEFTLPAA